MKSFNLQRLTRSWKLRSNPSMRIEKALAATYANDSNQRCSYRGTGGAIASRPPTPSQIWQISKPYSKQGGVDFAPHTTFSPQEWKSFVLEPFLFSWTYIFTIFLETNSSYRMLKFKYEKATKFWKNKPTFLNLLRGIHILYLMSAMNFANWELVDFFKFLWPSQNIWTLVERIDD